MLLLNKVIKKSYTVVAAIWLWLAPVFKKILVYIVNGQLNYNCPYGELIFKFVII